MAQFHLFNCDNVYQLSIVEDLLMATKARLGFEFSVEKHSFTLSEMSELSTKTIPAMKMDFAMFVVHAHESVLLINNDNLELGYSKVYKALLQATGENVIVVIGGDDNYKNETEEEQSVISRWAKRKIAHSQFSEESMDGRKSFVFSWNKNHRVIHEEALLHYFDPSKKGQKFEYQRPRESSSQTLESASFTELEKEVVEDDRSQQLSSLVSCIGIGKEVSDRAGARPKKFNMSRSPKDLEILGCNASEDSMQTVMRSFEEIALKLNLAEHPSVLNLSLEEVNQYLKKSHLKFCVLVVDAVSVEHAYESQCQQKYEELLATAADEVVEKVIILICDNCSLPPKDEEIVSRTIEDIITRRGKGEVAWLKKGKLSVGPDVLSRCLMSTSPTPQPNSQTNSLRASQEKNRDAPGSVEELFSTNSSQLPSGPLERHPSDWGRMQQAPTTIEPLMNTYTAKLVTGQPVLLRSILRYGKISREPGDLQLWDPFFIVPDFINTELIQLYQHTPEIGVRIVLGNDGQLQWSVDSKLIEVSKSRYKGIKITANETLMLKTRIRDGRVSFQENDVDFRYGIFQIPQEIINKLKKEHCATPCGVLYIISDEIGNLRSIVRIGKLDRLLTFVNKD